MPTCVINSSLSLPGANATCVVIRPLERESVLGNGTG